MHAGVAAGMRWSAGRGVPSGPPCPCGDGSAMGAMPKNLNDRAPRRKGVKGRSPLYGLKDLYAVRIGDQPAFFTGQNNAGRHWLSALARVKGVSALESANDAHLQQHIDCPIDRDGGKARSLACQPVENFVSADGAMGRRDLPEHLFAQGRKRYPMPPERLQRSLNGDIDALGVIVFG